MNEYGRYHTVSHVAVLLGILTFCVADAHAGLALISAVLVAGSWLLFRDSEASPLPRWTLNLLLLAATANMLRAVLASGRSLEDDAISILAQYLVSLQLIKLFEPRTPRDQLQLLLLNVMLVIGAVLTSVTFEVGAMLALYAPAFLLAVMHYQLFVGQRAGRQGETKERRRGLAGRGVARRRGTDEAKTTPGGAGAPRVARDLRRLTAFGVVLIASVAAVVFLLMPRNIGDDVLGRWPRAAAGASSGFSDLVQLGEEGLISESRDVVLEFDLLIGGQRVASEQNQYMRGTVLDQYDRRRGTWSRSERLRAMDKERSSQLRPGQGERGFDELPPALSPETSYEQVVSVRNKTTDHLFSRWRPVQVACTAQNPIYLNPEDKTLRMPNRGGMLTYRVRSVLSPDPQSEAHAGEWAGALEADNPFVGTPIEAYARALLEDAGLERTPDGHADQRILQLFERHLRDAFQYTLDLIAPPPGMEPLEAFLTQTKAGNCEYFASAMVAMAQSIGIPARIVTGYATNEVDPVTGSFLVRRSHAHAWVEGLVRVVIADPAEGAKPKWIAKWEQFDPTPPSELRALNEPRGGILGWAGRVWERVHQLWVKQIVAFDAERQQAVLKQTGISSLGFDRARSALERIPRASLRRLLQFFATALGAFLVLLAAIWFVRVPVLRAVIRAARFVRRLWLSRTDPGAARRLRQLDLYERMLRALERAGLGKPASSPPLAFASSLRETHPRAAEHVEGVARVYYSARFGTAPLSPEAIADAEARVRALRAELRDVRRKGGRGEKGEAR